MDRGPGDNRVLCLARSPAPGETHSIADRKQHPIDALIDRDLRVERLNHRHAWVGDRRIEYAPISEHVVHYDQAAPAYEPEAAFVICVIILLVRVNEREIEPRSVFRFKLVQRINRPADAKFDLVAHPCPVPGLLRNLSPLGACIAGHEAPFSWKGEGHGKRGVTGECPYFDNPPRRDKLNQEAQKMTLLWRDLHATTRHVL